MGLQKKHGTGGLTDLLSLMVPFRMGYDGITSVPRGPHRSKHEASALKHSIQQGLTISSMLTAQHQHSLIFLAVYFGHPFAAWKVVLAGASTRIRLHDSSTWNARNVACMSTTDKRLSLLKRAGSPDPGVAKFRHSK